MPDTRLCPRCGELLSCQTDHISEFDECTLKMLSWRDTYTCPRCGYQEALFR